jgi:hypothetical protein
MWNSFGYSSAEIATWCKHPFRFIRRTRLRKDKKDAGREREHEPGFDDFNRKRAMEDPGSARWLKLLN